MSQMFLFNNLTQGRGPLKAGVNPVCTVPGQDLEKGCGHGSETGELAIRYGGMQRENSKRSIW